MLPPVGTNPMEPDRSSGVCKDISPGPAPLRRLTRAEYDNTVRDLLGEDKRLARDFPPEELQHSFDNNAELRSVSDLLAQRYVGRRRAGGQDGEGQAGQRCWPATPAKDGEPACLDRFLDGFGTRVWRRPLEAGEREDLKKVFADGRGEQLRRGHRRRRAGDDAVAAVQLPAGARACRSPGAELRPPDPLGDGLAPVVPAVGQRCPTPPCSTRPGPASWARATR